MSVNDIYRVKLFQSFKIGGLEILNVFYYKQLTPGVTSEGAAHLAGEFEAILGPPIRNIQNEAIIWQSLEVANIIPGPDFVTNPYTNVTGQVSGESLPPFVTWSYRLNRSTSASRNGQKRFAGVTETSQDDGVPISGFVPILNSVGILLDDTLGGPPPRHGDLSAYHLPSR